ncbi:MAG: hypothetical protein LWX01_06845 [Deltaproteobacteria bacterium]|nr:hypothetical protein [Deltaproteobacteria bacterium]
MNNALNRPCLKMRQSPVLGQKLLALVYDDLGQHKRARSELEKLYVKARGLRRYSRKAGIIGSFLISRRISIAI